MAKVIQIPYQPRPWQAKAHASMSRFTVMVVHRRAGKTIFAVNELLKRVTQCDKKRPQVAYIAPTRVQAKQIAWEELKSLVRMIPGTKINESELRIDLPNKGRIMVLGAENPDALRGLYLDYAVLDEVADMPKVVWSQVLRPALADRQGGALFIGTPKGKNYFHDLYMQGMRGGNWSSILLTHRDTNALNEDELESLRDEMSEEEFRQELECSFTAAIRGAYYGKQIERAERERRITKVVPDLGSPVYTAWDIGFDGTSIWYAQVINDEVRIIDYDEFEDKDLPYCVNVVLGKSYVYEYHILPHDAKKRAITDKTKTVVGQLEKLGLRCKIADKLPILDGTSIWYAQVINDEVRIIDYDEFEDKDLPYCVNVVLGKSYVYEYHILPHDAKKRAITDKTKTVVGQLEKLGLRCKIADKLPILDGITSGRHLVDKAVFDSEKCAMGLEALRHYRAKFDESKGVMQQTPIHDEYSHGADAFRYLAVGLKPKRKYTRGQFMNKGGYDPFNRSFEVKNDWDVFK